MTDIVAEAFFLPRGADAAGHVTLCRLSVDVISSLAIKEVELDRGTWFLSMFTQ